MLGAHSGMIWFVNRVDANVADQDSYWARMQCHCHCDGRPLGFDTMDSGDAGQSAKIGRAARISVGSTDLCPLAVV